MKFRRSAALVAFAIGLGGCGSNNETSFQENIDRYFALVDRREELGGADAITPPGAFPTNYARYSGIIIIEALDQISFEVNETYAGVLRADADFDLNLIDVTASQFYDSLEDKLIGELSGEGGSIDRFADPFTEWQIVVSMDGVLVDANGVALTFDTVLGSDLIGPNGEMLQGNLEGTINSTYGLEDAYGYAIAKR